MKIYIKRMNKDWIFAVITGILAGLVLKGRLEYLVYRIMLSFSPVVPDIFMPGFYPDLICGAAGGFFGFVIYTVYNKKSFLVIKKAMIIFIIAISVFNAMFFVHVSYINYQLSRSVESLDSKNKFLPVKVHISSKDSLMVGSEYQSGGKDRSLLLKENSPYIKKVYEDIQNLVSKKIRAPYSDTDYCMWINYGNNKKYTSRVIWVGKDFAHERRIGIHDVKYDSEHVYGKVSEIMEECRDFDKSKLEYFSAEWYDVKQVGEGSKFRDVYDAELLFYAMLTSQNYNPNEDEKEFYDKFFNKHPITPQDGDLIALFYSIDTEQYEYIDVLLYDRTKKLLVFKDKDDHLKYVEYNLDTLFNIKNYSSKKLTSDM